jgi:hypothetical protein
VPGRPPMIALEAHPVRELAHLPSDPAKGQRGSHMRPMNLPANRGLCVWNPAPA